MKYPSEIVTIVRKKTFSIDAHFTRNANDRPMEIFDDTFSRYTMNVIADGKGAFANVHVNMLPGIVKKTEYAFNKHLDRQMSGQANEGNNRPAYTMRFVTGNLKGRTPADVLINDPNGKNELAGQYNWLQSNLAKYPNNRKLMDAIVDASKITEEEINGQKNSGTAPFAMTILDIGMRPLTRRQRPDGKCFVYEVKVIWDDSQEYPVTVMVNNYYAPVIKKENGMLNVQASQKDTSTEIRNSFVMTAEEWLGAVEDMQEAKLNFKSMFFADAYNIAQQAEKQARSNWQNNVNIQQGSTGNQNIPITAQNTQPTVSQPNYYQSMPQSAVM